MEDNAEICPDWLIVITHKHSEKQALSHLKMQNFRAYCPVSLKIIRHARQNRSELLPFFPGHIFVESPPEPAIWRPIRSTQGVKHIMMKGAKPALLTAKIIDCLKAHEAYGALQKCLSSSGKCQNSYFDSTLLKMFDLTENDRTLLLLSYSN
jgi:transcriptional antiterminator RfaH